MKKNIKLIFVMILSLMLIIGGVYVYLKDTHNSNNSIISNITNTDNKIVTRITNLNEFYRVKNALNKFYVSCRAYNFPEVDPFEEDEDIDPTEFLDEVYYILDAEYIKKYNISMDNIADKIKDFTVNEVQINDIYRIQKNNDISMYLVYISELSISDDNDKDIYFVLKLDDQNKYFSVYLEDYVKDNNYDKLKENDEIRISIYNIESNNFNTYENTVVYNTKYQEDLFNDFRKSCMSNLKRAYSLLDEETKNKKFDTFEKFSNYISQKMSDIVIMKINSCKVEEKENITLYKYTSTKDMNFTIKEIAPLKYTVVIE